MDVEGDWGVGTVVNHNRKRKIGKITQTLPLSNTKSKDEDTVDYNFWKVHKLPVSI